MNPQGVDLFILGQRYTFCCFPGSIISMADSALKIAATECIESPQEINEQKAQIVKDYIRDSKHFKLLTGARISTSVGRF